MKSLAFAATILLSSAAFAQTTTTDQSQPGSQMPTSEMPAPVGEATPATPAMPATPADPATGPATPSDGAMPASPSAQANASPGMPVMAPMAATPAPAAQAVYPRCSRTVVDQCQQGPSRERDTKRSRRR